MPWLTFCISITDSRSQNAKLIHMSCEPTRNVYLLTLKGPSPGEPSPPLIQVVTHLIVQDSAFLDFGFWIRAFLQSLGKMHSPDSVCGMLARVSPCSGASIARPTVAAEANTVAAATKPAVATMHLLLALASWQVLLMMMPLVFLVLVLILLRRIGVGP